MQIDLLTTCIVNFLQILISQYTNKQISYEIFGNNIELKKKFLENFIENIQCIEEKNRAYDILKKCNDIIIKQ